jgi:hypothetical protein
MVPLRERHRRVFRIQGLTLPSHTKAPGFWRRSCGAVQRARHVLATIFFPVDEPARGWVVVVIAVIAAVAAILRLGSIGMNTLWAEDGQIFYGEAMHSYVHAFFQSYYGYWQATPRIIAAVVVLFPVSWAAAVTAVADAAVLGLLAALVYRASGAHIRNPWLRAVPALLTAVCPVGMETAGSIADLQWAMFFVTIVVLMWNPRRPAPIAAGLLTVALTTLTNPFGLLLAPLAVVRIATFGRSRGSLIPLVTLASSAVEMAAMAMIGGRQTYYTIMPGSVARIYAASVAGPGFFGSRPHLPWLALGTAVVVATVVALMLVAASGRLRESAIAAVMLAYSGAYFLAPVVVSGMPLRYGGGNRYFVGPMLLLAYAVIVLLDSTLRGDRVVGWAEGSRLIAVVVCAALVACLAWSTAASWRVRNPHRLTPSWSAALASAHVKCSHGAHAVHLRITPPTRIWAVVLTCAQVTRNGGPH